MADRFKNLVFTHHAQERMVKRRISAQAVFRTIQTPDTKQSSADGPTKFIRDLNQRRYHVVAEYDHTQHVWVVVSVWVRGEEDQPSLEWQLITLPFKVLAWLGRGVIKLVRNQK